MNTEPQQMRTPFKPDPAMVYLTDNGRALCGDHLGSSARFTGRDLSGQRIMACTPDVVRESLTGPMGGWHPACERCGRKASLLVAA